MDESHLAAALRYVALNPARARLVGDGGLALVERPGAATDDGDGVTCLARSATVPSFADLLDDSELETMTSAVRSAETIGRPPKACSAREPEAINFARASAEGAGAC